MPAAWSGQVEGGETAARCPQIRSQQLGKCVQLPLPEGTPAQVHRSKGSGVQRAWLLMGSRRQCMPEEPAPRALCRGEIGPKTLLSCYHLGGLQLTKLPGGLPCESNVVSGEIRSRSTNRGKGHLLCESKQAVCSGLEHKY